MAGVSGGLLAARVSQAGALGLIGVGHVPDPKMWLANELGVVRRELNIADEEQRLDVGVGFFGWKLDLMPRAEAEELLLWTARRVSCIWLSFGERTRVAEWTKLLKNAPEANGCAVAALVNTVQEVLDVIISGCEPDMLVVQSFEAGGHGSPHALPLISLVPAVLDALKVYEKKPLVIAAGGIASGAQVVAALALGADGVACGTLFVASEESTYLPAQKTLIVTSTGEETVRTKVFDQMRYVLTLVVVARTSLTVLSSRGTTLWPDPVDGRAISNQTMTDALAGTDDDTQRAAYAAAVANQDVTRIVTWAGTSVGAVRSVAPARDIVARLRTEAQAVSPEQKSPLSVRLPWVTLPVLCPPMAGLSGGLLAGRVTKAGGLGLIGNDGVTDAINTLGREYSTAREELGITDQNARLPIGTGFLVWQLDDGPTEAARELVLYAARHVSCIWFSFGTTTPAWVRFLRAAPEGADVLIIVLVNTLWEVRALIDTSSTPDILVAQGMEAGGHGSSDALPIFSLLPAVRAALDMYEHRPLLIAAGGVVDGAQLAAVRALGADGVACGTLFAAAAESLILLGVKEAMVAARGEDTVRTRVIDDLRYALSIPIPTKRSQIVSGLPWPPHVDGRVITNLTLDDAAAGIDADVRKEALAAAIASSDITRVPLWAGTSVGQVRQIAPAEHILADMRSGYEASLLKLGSMFE
jgi:nitronate monooxygenase